ncbi:hypothetical protein PtrSN002B_009220 [Pyrenophora tritici-repentis]|nr:hypothetical protein PtrV1_12250 [Pyrenophora tritici-repentis]KAF7445053.1 hypothetical protein A1F99_100380 [Pyrenophora tritici-repentis]KAI0572093.1 hypothetical protein Alg215_09995 [Pyrenophora tritici-repentis]KAI1538060.1 hypothetical protein PtrSN002B_009220 [Pyrenophora tritici-repentis]KAI1594000.1 hypothetical protein PtrEW13061_002706 [Pyrenophora tritici-repentis]
MIFSQTPTTLILSILTASTFTHALPTTTYPPHPLCKNTLTNPSFATGSLTPWLDMVTGSWSMRGITTTSSNSSGPYIYTAHSNSTTVTATLALSQSYITIPADSTTTTVECYAYVRSDRPTGQTRVQVFLDALSCGG